ncbi:MAG: dTDP-4-amino-4,6-dideoxygalactose transaminase [Syntrophaceae bacterium]|nr:dTDP-4-amino-4,6-dideoxygalactose transaminase [Syntrophaceae bacterium]
MNSIPFNKPFIVGKELFYIAQAVIENGYTSGDGLFTKKCQNWLEKNLCCQKALLTHSCTAALEMAAILAEIQPGDEIIMPSFTFVSTANAFALRGGVPVFVDIHPDTLNMNEALIEAAVTARTRAIVPVHYAGVPCRMDEITEVAVRKGLIVIEDAAQALLSQYKGRCVGAEGQMICLSFHETKNIICGEGGAILINDPLFIQRAEIIREKGTNRSQFFRGHVDKYTWVDIGSSFLPSDILAAFLYAQMENAEQIIAKRNLIFDLYMEELRPLANAGHIQIPLVMEDSRCNGHLFYILTKSLKERTDLNHFLDTQGITAVFHYVPLHSSPAGRKYGRISGTMKVTEHISDCLLRLPLYYEMEKEDVQRVISAIRTFYKY